jgi:hypothetical protein
VAVSPLLFAIGAGGLGSGIGVPAWLLVSDVCLAGGLVTLFVGATQWALMRTNRPSLAWWMATSGLAGAACAIPSFLVITPFSPTTERITQTLKLGVLAGLSYGVLSGIGFLRPQRRKSFATTLMPPPTST